MEEKKLTDEEIVKALENMRSTDTVGFFYDKENKQYVYATAKEVFDLIHRQKAEIERLTEENRTIVSISNGFALERNNLRDEVNELLKEKRHLQKQVDELKQTISIKEGYIDRVESEVVEWQFATKKAVKDTAKEIFTELLKDENVEINVKLDQWGEPYNVACVDFYTIEEMAKRYGVEVE